MKTKKITLLLATLLMGSSVFSACDVGVQYAPQEKDDVSYLYVQCSTGGFGSEYLTKLETAFEAKFKDQANYFAEGKTGVDVVVSESSGANGRDLRTSIANSNQDVVIAAGFFYFDYLANNLLYDLTDITKETLEDGTTIEGKLFDNQKEALTIDNGKYYALPTFAGWGGLTYDAQLFADNCLYFSDDLENSSKPYNRLFAK